MQIYILILGDTAVAAYVKAYTTKEGGKCRPRGYDPHLHESSWNVEVENIKSQFAPRRLRAARLGAVILSERGSAGEDRIPDP
jgi:hypothetical protein